MWEACGENALCAHPCLSILRIHCRPRPQCGDKHFKGRAGPSWTRGIGCGDEARIRGALAPAECQPFPRREVTTHFPWAEGYNGRWHAAENWNGQAAIWRHSPSPLPHATLFPFGKPHRSPQTQTLRPLERHTVAANPSCGEGTEEATYERARWRVSARLRGES